MIKAGNLDVVDSKGGIANQKFLEAIQEKRKASPAFGISYRWMAAVAEDQESLELQLQVLPMSVEILLGNPTLTQDNVPVMVVGRYDVEMDMFQDEIAVGPKPVFFSMSPESTANALR